MSTVYIVSMWACLMHFYILKTCSMKEWAKDLYTPGFTFLLSFVPIVNTFIATSYAIRIYLGLYEEVKKGKK